MTEDTTTFVWDESSQLYYHASTGFYHDPNGGWYYSTKDGLYYKYENGNYVLFHAEESHQQGELKDEQFDKIDDVEQKGLVSQESTSASGDMNHPPPSEWLEDTLIELYLSGYSNGEMANDVPADGAGENNEVEEGECNSDEECWRAQYGQVTHENEELLTLNSRLVDLWEWRVVKESKKRGKGDVTRVIGRLVKPSMKVHPSGGGGGLFKTAPICEVHLDLVRVTSGQIYRLRSPSSQYLGSASTYDSSNPTKDWLFPPLTLSTIESNRPDQDKALSIEQVQKRGGHGHNTYRDRAAERRAFHGGFGVGPGQKKTQNDVDSDPSSPMFDCPEKAAAESLNLSFGTGSYARKILESMGWKEGEALGSSSTTGLTEPLEAKGNIGNAGVGWDNNTATRFNM